MLATLSAVLVPDNGVASGLSQGPLWLRLYPGTFFSFASSDSGGQRQLTLSQFLVYSYPACLHNSIVREGEARTTVFIV